MSIAAPEQPAQKPEISYRSPEWVRLRAGHPDTRAANDPQEVDAAVESARESAAATTDGNGQDVKGNGQSSEAVRIREQHPSVAVRMIMDRIASKMDSLRPGKHPKHVEVARHGDFQSILRRAQNGASPQELVFALLSSNHKGVRSLGQNIVDDPSVHHGGDYVSTPQERADLDQRIDAILEQIETGRARSNGKVQLPPDNQPGHPAAEQDVQVV